MRSNAVIMQNLLCEGSQKKNSKKLTRSQSASSIPLPLKVQIDLDHRLGWEADTPQKCSYLPTMAPPKVCRFPKTNTFSTLSTHASSSSLLALTESTSSNISNTSSEDEHHTTGTMFTIGSGSHNIIRSTRHTTDEHEHPNHWYNTITHIPDRMRKYSADKNRFNVYTLTHQDREQLKQMYVY